MHSEAMFWVLRLLVFVLVPPLSEALKLRRGLAMEVVAMRHDLAFAARKEGKIQRPNAGFKAFWALFCRVWPRWNRVCFTVKPATVVRWHRAGFRICWKWKSRKRGGRQKRVELIALIRKWPQRTRLGVRHGSTAN